jgi:hypothetical protein
MVRSSGSHFWSNTSVGQEWTKPHVTVKITCFKQNFNMNISEDLDGDDVGCAEHKYMHSKALVMYFVSFFAQKIFSVLNLESIAIFIYKTSHLFPESTLNRTPFFLQLKDVSLLADRMPSCENARPQLNSLSSKIGQNRFSPCNFSTRNLTRLLLTSYLSVCPL